MQATHLIKIQLLVIFICLLNSYQSLFAIDRFHFPLRDKYKNVTIILHDELYRQLDQVLVIDVRSKYEYDTIHIINAINVPISNLGFIPRLKEIRQNDPRPIVFYCNGITCEKSYKASEKAQHHGITQVSTLDLGIRGWTHSHPDAAVLFGETPVPLNDLITTEHFSNHSLSPEIFLQTIDVNTLVVDIRDPFQRTVKIFEKISSNVPLSRFPDLLIRAKKNNKTLLIFDAVGKQVRWLQYSLEHEKFDDYYFMEGGVDAFINANMDR